MADTGTFLGRRIREMREAAGLAQSDITGVHRTLLGAIERGERTCTVRTLEKIAAALRCEVADFFVAGPSGRDSPQQRLGRSVAAVAADATDEEMERFRDIALIFFRRTPARRKRSKGRP